MSGVLLWIFLLGASFLLFWRQIRGNRRRNLIDKIPGPKSWPIFGSVGFYMKIKNADVLFELLTKYAKMYRPILRIWWLHVPMVKIGDPKYLEIFLGNAVNITKSQEYDFVSEWLGRGLLTSTGSKWHSRRKMLTPTFHFSILEQFVPVFCDKTRILIEKLKSASTANPESVDIVPYVTMCTLDIISETAMGVHVNAQEDSNSKYVSTLHELVQILMQRMFSPWFYPDFIYHLSSLSRRQGKCVKILRDFTRNVIQERQAERNQQNETDFGNDADLQIFGKRKKMAFLDLLLDMQKTAGLSDEDIREEVDTFMFEGHDTVSTGLSWTFYYLSTHPQVQAECKKELEEIFGDSSRDPELSDLNNMKYLERVIKESLRLRPPVWSIGRKLDHDVVLDEKYTIPAGVTVTFDMYNVHMNPEIYPDPEKFDPDRFLPENCVGRHPYAYIPFSAGPRNCIGQKFAMLEMKEVVSTVLRHFELRAVDPKKDGKVVPDMILRPKNGINLKLLPRV